jgi:hypothetical protein
MSCPLWRYAQILNTPTVRVLAMMRSLSRSTKMEVCGISSAITVRAMISIEITGGVVEPPVFGVLFLFPGSSFRPYESTINHYSDMFQSFFKNVVCALTALQYSFLASAGGGVPLP